MEKFFPEGWTAVYQDVNSIEQPVDIKGDTLYEIDIRYTGMSFSSKPKANGSEYRLMKIDGALILSFPDLNMIDVDYLAKRITFS